jgi:hypothetical protein
MGIGISKFSVKMRKENLFPLYLIPQIMIPIGIRANIQESRKNSRKQFLSELISREAAEA